MKIEYITIDAPGKKIIPVKYKEPILKALSCYPELSDVNIHFKVVLSHSVPFSTQPAFTSLFKPVSKRMYQVIILEEAKEPMYSALLKNLPEDEQVAIIAHELVHVIQFHACNPVGLLTTILTYPIPIFRKKLERSADKGAIEHLQGLGLYHHALHIRSIPGYPQKRPDINKYYLKPVEILDYMIKLEANK